MRNSLLNNASKFASSISSVAPTDPDDRLGRLGVTLHPNEIALLQPWNCMCVTISAENFPLYTKNVDVYEIRIICERDLSLSAKSYRDFRNVYTKMNCQDRRKLDKNIAMIK